MNSVVPLSSPIWILMPLPLTSCATCYMRVRSKSAKYRLSIIDTGCAGYLMHPAAVFFAFSHPVKRAWTVRLGSLTACRTKSPEFCRSCRAGTGCEVAPLARRSAAIFSATFDMPHHMRCPLPSRSPPRSMVRLIDPPPPPCPRRSWKVWSEFCADFAISIPIWTSDASTLNVMCDV